VDIPGYHAKPKLQSAQNANHLIGINPEGGKMNQLDRKLLQELANALPFNDVVYQETTIHGHPSNRGSLITLLATRKYPEFGKGILVTKFTKKDMRMLDKATFFKLIEQKLNESQDNKVMKKVNAYLAKP